MLADEGVGIDPEPDRQRALRIEVHQQHVPAELGQRSAEIDRRGGLADPPFWLHMAMIRAGPCSVSGGGVGRSGHGRPVGPISGSGSTDCAMPSGGAATIGVLNHLGLLLRPKQRPLEVGGIEIVLVGQVSHHGGASADLVPSEIRAASPSWSSCTPASSLPGTRHLVGCVPPQLSAVSSKRQSTLSTRH